MPRNEEPEEPSKGSKQVGCGKTQIKAGCRATLVHPTIDCGSVEDRTSRVKISRDRGNRCNGVCKRIDL